MILLQKTLPVTCEVSLSETRESKRREGGERNEEMIEEGGARGLSQLMPTSGRVTYAATPKHNAKHYNVAR